MSTHNIFFLWRNKKNIRIFLLIAERKESNRKKVTDEKNIESFHLPVKKGCCQ